jgi:hypothetical protein
MRAALYYPSWGIPGPRFMFEALLYWDRLACIVPFEGFSPHADWPSGFEHEAESLHERFVTGLAPGDRAKSVVHERLSAMLQTTPPDWCRVECLTSDTSSFLAIRKVAPRTIDMLTTHGWLAIKEDDSLATISRAACNVILGALVTEMASESMAPVTDDPATFRATCNGLLRELQFPVGIDGPDERTTGAKTAVDLETDTDLGVALVRVLRLGIDGADVTPQMLRRLGKLRNDSSFDQQRERFCDQIDRYVADLRRSDTSIHPLIHDDWKQKLATDRDGLKRELRSAGVRSIVDKEGLLATGVGAVAGTGALSAAGPAGLLVGLGITGAGIVDSTRRRRAEVIERHWTSWLHSASGERIRFTTRTS